MDPKAVEFPRGPAGWGIREKTIADEDGCAGDGEVLCFEEVSKYYGGRPVLDRISFSIREGEHVSLIGESTSGKSTIFKIIVGLVEPDGGRVKIFGQDPAPLKEQEKIALRRSVQMQFQSGALFDSQTVWENINFSLDEQTSLASAEKKAITERLLKGVNLLSSRDKYPYELSGGMKKRVAVVRALAPSPRLALFDEPAAGLDPVTTARIVNLIKSLVVEHRMTMIAATTDVHLAAGFSKRIILLNRGRIHQDAAFAEMKASEDDYTQKFLARILEN